MELRVLRYFLAVAEEGSMTHAAETLHTTQSNLSRQLANLERECGHKLFERGARRVTLTEGGVYLRRRAAEIVELADRTQQELVVFDEVVSGSVHVGAIETRRFYYLTRAMDGLRRVYPRITFDLMSGSNTELVEMLDRGLLDLSLLVEPVDLAAYDYLRLPVREEFGVLTRADSPLAKLPAVTPADLRDRPLLVSHQQFEGNVFSGWFVTDPDALNVVATFNLVTNAATLVAQGVGNALAFDGLVDRGGEVPLVFRPLDPPVEAGLVLVWKKSVPLTRATRLYLDQLRA